MSFTPPPAPPAVPSVREILAAGIAGNPIPPPAVVQSGPFAGWRIVAPADRAPGAVQPHAPINLRAIPSWDELCHARQRIEASEGIVAPPCETDPERRSEILLGAPQPAGAAPAAASGRLSTAAEAEAASTAFLAPATGISPAETPEPA